jgi:hypothetical protein
MQGTQSGLVTDDEYIDNGLIEHTCGWRQYYWNYILLSEGSTIRESLRL